MASTIKVDTIDTPSGSGNISVNRPLSGSGASLTSLPAANLTGSIAAIDGNGLVGISPRNFIIDGDFTQWPTGTSATSVGSGTYVSALMQGYVANTSGTMTIERSTDVPTIAQSGHQSAYSHLAKCTGADTSLGIDDLALHRYHVTGSDFAHLHQQQVTVSFWAKTAAANSGDTYALTFHNGTFNRCYVHEFTPTSSWTQFTHTLTLDTSGTWLFTETDKALVVGISLVGASGYDDATNDTWGGTNEFSAGNVDNFYDSTSNEFYMAQFGLYLGSTAPNFTSPSISTVKNQVDYYVQRYNLNSSAYETLCGLNCRSGTHAKATMTLRNELRTSPTVTSSAASTWSVNSGSNDAAPTTIAFSAGGRTGWNIDMTVSSRTTGHSGYLYRTGTNTTFIMFDARH